MLINVQNKNVEKRSKNIEKVFVSWPEPAGETFTEKKCRELKSNKKFELIHIFFKVHFICRLTEKPAGKGLIVSSF